MNFISPCNHPESYLSGSTIESMVNKISEMNLPYFACTDNGNLLSVLKAYGHCKKKDIKLIAGVEVFFKDDNCSVLKDLKADPFKYSKLIIHAKDQTAYEKLIKMVSDPQRPQVNIQEQDYGLFNWLDLEEMSKYNFTVCTSNVESIGLKYLLAERADVAEAYLRKLLDLFKDDFYLSILPFTQDMYWNSLIQAEIGGEKVEIPSNSRIETNKYKFAKAIELTKRDNGGHKELKAVYLNNIRYTIRPECQEIKSAKPINRFVEMKDVQTQANKFVIDMSFKLNMTDKVLINSYSYYTDDEDKVVQDMKLGDTKRLWQSQYIMSSEDAMPYLKEKLELPEATIEQFINNSYVWAKKFDSFQLKYDYRLPSTDREPKAILIDRIKEFGRMKWDDKRYVSQFREELKLLTENDVLDLVPYFLPIIDIYDFYSENGHLTGPARGSAGGFLISYLIGITHVDPIKYGLSSSRFLTMDRVQSGNLPDIDCDLEDRTPLVGRDGNSGYLFNKYGKKAAQVSTRTLLRIKSAILDANRFVNKGTVEKEIEALSKSLPTTPQGINDQDFVFGYEDSDGNHVEGLIETSEDLQKYATERPQEWNIVKRALSLSRQNSRHACFAGKTLVETDNGIEYMEDQPVKSQGKSITVWSSGIKPTILVGTNKGVALQCTPDHIFFTKNGTEIEAQNLLGKQLSLSAIKNTSGKDKPFDSDEAFALGWFLNDGNYVKSANRFEFYFTPGRDDQALFRVKEWLDSIDITLKQATKRKDTWICYGLSKHFKSTAHTKEKRLPKYFWKLEYPLQLSFMRGLFSANGYVLNTRATLGIKLTSKLLVSDIAVWLNSKEILTSCSYSKPKTTQHYNGVYTSKSTATLTITGYSNKERFKNYIGFEQKYKSDRLNYIVNNGIKSTRKENPVKCIFIEASVECEVWDFNEPKDNKAYINGLLVHNCAFIISDTDIEDTVPIMEVGGVKRVTQPEHKDCESAGLIKYDFLVVSALKDINLCLKYINKKNKVNDLETGYFHHNDKKEYVWNLPVDQDVFKMMWEGKTETVFQLNSVTATPLVKKIKPESILDCAVITSLGRPGPLDFKDEKTGRNMADEYAFRKAGMSKGELQILEELLPETYGILVFQEQVTKIARELGQMSVIDAENVRIGMGKKKIKLLNSLKPEFIKGASEKVGVETAETVWSMMATFARYGFNKSHAVAYSVISYACAFMKYHYPLEWWAAVLSNADDKEINEVFYKYVKDKVLPPDVNTSTEEMEVDYNISKIRNKLSVISGLGEKAADKIISKRPYKDLKDFVRKEACGPALTRKLVYVGALDSLFKPGLEDITKLSILEDTFKQVEFENRMQDYKLDIEALKSEGDEKALERKKKSAKRFYEKGPKKSEVPTDFIGLSSKKVYQLKKSVFPTMNLDLMETLKKDSSLMINKTSKGLFLVMPRKEQRLLDGEHLQSIDRSDVAKPVWFATPGYIMDTKEFTYKNHSRKALRVIIDSSGYISEKVLWPDYNTGELTVDPELKKGAIVYILYNKKPGSPYTNIKEIYIEEKSIL